MYPRSGSQQTSSPADEFRYVPEELKALARWVVWRYESPNGRGKPTKVPYDARTGLRASSTDVSTWSSFVAAQKQRAQYSGIGFVLGSSFIGVDLDDCRDPATGEITVEAQGLISRLKSYTEISPSKTGVKVFGQGELPAGRRKTQKLEVYGAGRFFTVTGWHLPETPLAIEPLDTDLLIALLQPSANGTAKAFSSSNGKIPEGNRHDYLMHKAGQMLAQGHSQEETLAAVLGLNAQRCNPPKSNSEVRMIVDYCAQRESEKRKPVASGNALVITRGDQCIEKPLVWLWKPYLPCGKLIHFGGNSGQAKSPVTIDLAARLSVGAPWPDGAENCGGPRSVLLLNVEDDLSDTILPRFRVAGGEKRRFFHVGGTRVQSEAGDFERGVVLTQDTELLVKAAHDIEDLGLIVVDPITNYLGSSNMNREEEVRAILTPLANLAAELDVTIVTVGHFNRRERGTDPLHRMMGAAAFSGVARAAYAFGPDPEEESKYCHVMTTVRSCGGEGPALRYRTELISEVETEIIRVIWNGTSTASAEDTVDPLSSKDKVLQSEAAEVLLTFLGGQEKPAQECQEFLKASGFDPAQMNMYRVRKRANVETRKDGRHWYWSASSTASVAPKHAAVISQSRTKADDLWEDA